LYEYEACDKQKDELKNLALTERAPINFWEPVKVEEEDSTTKTSYEDSICHEVKYNPADKDESESYKLYIKPFSHGIAEQWLKFKEQLNIVIHGNGLDNDGWACFNVTCSSLKGEALCVFNDKAVEQKEETTDSHVQCLRANTEHVFPADNPLHLNRNFYSHHVFLHLSDRTISEFHTRWIELNNYLDECPPFGSNQHFTEDQTKDILNSIIPKHWQSYLQQDKFDIIQCSVEDFFDMMECYQLTDQLDPSLKQQNQSKTDKHDSKKSTEKPNDKKCKAKLKKNDSDALVPNKRTCMTHGPNSSHMTNECQTL
jgi:hypothetical protein